MQMISLPFLVPVEGPFDLESSDSRRLELEGRHEADTAAA
jgi:hypothetical protein